MHIDSALVNLFNRDPPNLSGLFGFTNMAAGTAVVAKVMFLVAGAMFLIFLAVGLAIEKRQPGKL